MAGLSFFLSVALSVLCSLHSTCAAAAPSRRLNGDVTIFNHGGLSASANNVVSTRPAAAPNHKTNVTLSASSSVTFPRFVIYSDKWVSGLTGPPATTDVTGYNTFILSFLLTEGAFDKAAEWTQLTAAQRTTIKSQYNAAGIKLLVSLFGSTDVPTTSGDDPVTTANTMAAWAIQYDLDGVDVDYEDFNAMKTGNGAAESWLVTFTQQLRTQLPQGQYILTHAPVAPWFSPNIWAGGAYLTVDQTVGNLIDWYNVQFYNPSGVSPNKLVIGKPANTGDANSGYIAPATLATCLSQAKAQGWNAGAMVWEYPDATTSWIQTVRAQAFPE